MTIFSKHLWGAMTFLAPLATPMDWNEHDFANLQSFVNFSLTWMPAIWSILRCPTSRKKCAALYFDSAWKFYETERPNTVFCLAEQRMSGK